ncbi:MAG: metallophosphoesterase [Verrucomicrobia bacterium]|nr:metallophosphoesterase [Verrucomicrobiota bacterium]
MKKSTAALVLIATFLSASPLFGAIAQYDFNGNLNSSTSGVVLTTGFAAPATNAVVVFTNMTINGNTAQVASFTRGTYFTMSHGLGANGGGSKLNQYTLILDVMFPSRPSGWAVLYQTTPQNTNDGEWFINPSQGLGISSVYGGTVADGTWHRLAVVVDSAAGTLTSFINGTPVQQVGGPTVDGRWAMGPTVLLFADDDLENAAGFVNSVQLRAEAMTTNEIAALGGATATGIPMPGATNPLFGQVLQTNGGFETLFANWQTIAGSPLALTSAGSKGSPHGGAYFFHGGINTPASNTVVRQDIDLLAAGFTTNDLDTGAALDSLAWLRNFYGVNTFDDQVFYRVGYLDAADQELSAVRCIVAGNSVWLQRNLYGLLPAGTRKLRVEIIGQHRRDADNDSMADDLIVKLQQPFPLPTPNISKLPMLQDVRPNAMTLIWETDGNLARHYVDWGRSNITEHTLGRIETLQIDATHFVHRATIPGLETETSYVYRVRSGTNATATYTFFTAPKRSSLFITAWWGDNHGGTVTLATHVTNLLSHAPNLICVAGDTVNSGNSLSEWHNFWFKPLETLNAAQTTPVIFARGNHDGEHALAYAYSALPGNEAWFAFDYGNSRFIFLDSEINTSGSPEQYNWLQAELSRPETQTAAFRIVCFHKPPYADLWNGGGYTGETFVRNDWVPLFTQKNVDIVICGHMHAYQRGATNGVMYIVSGGGGGALDTERVAFWPFVQVEYSQYHFDIMEVNGQTLSWETFNNSNQLLDMFTLQSRVPVVAWQNAAGAAGQLQLTVSGKPGISYVLESSSNLLHWAAFATNTIAASGPPMFTNSIGVDVFPRFIRARTSQ